MNTLPEGILQHGENMHEQLLTKNVDAHRYSMHVLPKKCIHPHTLDGTAIGLPIRPGWCQGGLFGAAVLWQSHASCMGPRTAPLADHLQVPITSVVLAVELAGGASYEASPSRVQDEVVVAKQDTRDKWTWKS